ncbi:MAG: anti-sigma factor antagonist [Ruminococcus sp.]|nr:anti-sigma factor antagonist [Ruminococcus sp.]
MFTDVRVYPERTVFASIKGDIDHHTAKSIRTQIDRTINDSDPKLLIMDFSEVTFMDSSGIGLVMGRYKLMTERGGEVIISEPAGYIKKVFQLSGIDKLTKIVSDPTGYIKEDVDTINEEEQTNEAKAY